ncbi:hypothetical protein [Gemmata massiliana]|uniref:hypothetical protein n=1 Tax=Gemmata massiliana TaxID=1210884 RepID=UPI0013A6973A|nr:hypothetical protein [Gemmata massiliana]
MNEILLAFLQYAEQHYRRGDGTQTDEVKQFKQTFRVVRERFGVTPAREFGPRSLKNVRQAMIEVGWSRKLVNQRVGRVKRVFKWAASEELLPVAVFQSLATVTGLQAGRTEAEECDPVKPVADSAVDATLSQLNRHVAGLVMFQRRTGCRPGEACRVRSCDLDMTQTVWVYCPPQHKTAHRDGGFALPDNPRELPQADQTLLRKLLAGIWFGDLCMRFDPNGPLPPCVTPSLERLEVVRQGRKLAGSPAARNCSGYSCAKIPAQDFGINTDIIRSFLSRFSLGNPDCRNPVESGRGEAKYTYRREMVIPALKRHFKL